MPEKTNLEKLEDILSTVADVIRQAEGTDDPVLVSSMRERIALAYTVRFTVDTNGTLTSFDYRYGSEDTSIPVDTEDYYRKLLVNFADKIRRNSAKLDIDDILADRDKTCGTVVEQGGKYGMIIPNCVTSIPQRLAWKKQGLTSVVIPSSVTKIGAFAFQECADLVSATVNATISDIPESMFTYCSNLTNVVLSNTITTIEMDAFAQCSSLDTIDISNVTSIGPRAFSGCYKLEHVTFPINLESLGSYAFAGCKIKSLPDLQNLTSILDNTFENCKYLQDIVIPNNIKSIGYHAFYVDKAPIRRIIVPSDADVHVQAFLLTNVNYLETVDAPLNCCHVGGAPNLTSLHINSGSNTIHISGPNNLPSLVDLTLPTTDYIYTLNGFNGCPSLVNLVIPEGVERILQDAFKGCTSLQNLTLPKSLISIEIFGVFTDSDLSNGNVTVYFNDTLDNIEYYFFGRNTIPTVLVQMNVSTATFIDINGNSADMDPSVLIPGGSGSGSGSGSGDGDGEEESYEE